MHFFPIFVLPFIQEKGSTFKMFPLTTFMPVVSSIGHFWSSSMPMPSSSSFLPYVVLTFKAELRLVNIEEVLWGYINLKDSCRLSQ